MNSLNFEPESFSGFPPAGDTFDAHEGPTTLRMRAIRARILWPALGFPAVISPQPGSAAKPFDADASHCVCALILSDAPSLTKEDVAQYLRIVPWSQRDRRHIAAGQPGSFNPSDIEVLSDIGGKRISMPQEKDDYCEAVSFGGTSDGANKPIVVGLSRHVRDFYSRELPNLYEIRVSEAASANLAEGQYQLFWNNAAAEGTPSDEMNFLIESFAKPQRRKLGPKWAKWFDFFVNEYKYEYGALHPPYRQGNSQNGPLTEVLHPVFVKRYTAPIRIAQVTDTHVDIRWDVYEANLRLESKLAGARFNNCNKNFVRIYNEANQQSDVILLTGDLIDYGRGHIGPDLNGHKVETLGRDDHYHEDRNWFLFYYLLASGQNYSKPAYTILGNHDWRLNPYPPFAPGAPDLWELFDSGNDSKKFPELKELLKLAHGPGHEQKYSYVLETESYLKVASRGIRAFFGDLAQDGSPVQTRIESIKWYLLLINPFLNYSFSLPSGQQLLMLDFAKDESLQNPDKPYAENWLGFGPRAAKCPTAFQKWLLDHFMSAPGTAKVIGVHVPPMGPFPEWTDAELMQGIKTYHGGKDSFFRKPNGPIVQISDHLTFAIRPTDEPYGVAADYGSFAKENERNWFITNVWNSTHGIRLILSGHIHRRGLFTVRRYREQGKDYWKLQDVSAFNIKGMHFPLAASSGGTNYLGPLYVNTTSAGPLGHEYGTQYKSMKPGWSWMSLASDGTIVNVTHVPPRFVQVPSRLPAIPPHEFEHPVLEHQSPHQGNLMNTDLNFEAEAFSSYPPQSENTEQLEQEHHFAHGGHYGGHMFHGFQHGSGHKSRWRRHRFASGDSMQDQQSIGWAQNCLAQITGSNISQSGRKGHATRRAIRRFQMQNQLQPTGRLDQNTMSALQQACGDQDDGGDQGDGDNETRYSAFEFDQPTLNIAPSPAYTPRNCDNGRFPSPSVVNRALTSARVQCPTRADAQRILGPVIKKAVEMLDHTIEELTRARESACRGEPLGYPNLREVTACWLKYKLGVCIDNQAAWTGGPFSSRSVAEVIRRLIRPRDLLASNEIVYVCDPSCQKASTIAWTHVANKDKDRKWHCIPGAPDRVIHLCPPFWTDAQAPFREQTLIHETVHLTHCAAAEDNGTRVSIGSPECLAQFVAATNLQELDPDFVGRCGFINRCGPIPPQQFGRNCGAKTHTAPPPLHDWRP